MSKLCTQWKTLTAFYLNANLRSQEKHVSRTFNLHKPIYRQQIYSSVAPYSIAPLRYCGCLNQSSILFNNVLHPASVTIRHYVSKNEDEKKSEENSPLEKPSLYQRFKTMYRDYWYVLVPVHLVTSAGWFGGFYYMASSGVDIVSVLESLNVSDKLINPLRNGHATTGYLAISYALYKLATPVRYTVTLGGTTISINYLKRWGYIKPVPSKEKLKEMYDCKKEVFREKRQSFKDNVIQSLKPEASKKKNP